MVATLSALLVTTLATQVASAGHGANIPPRWWDLDNDGLGEASDSRISFRPSGGSWTTAKGNRLSEALAEWRNDTDFNPFRDDAGASNVVFVDGRNPCSGTWAVDYPNSYAVNCVVYVNRNPGTPIYYQDIGDSDIYFNMDPKWNWNYSTGGGGSSFVGVLTHELGHAVALKDLYGSACPVSGESLYTMCGTISQGDTVWLQTLTSDDINSANPIYLP